MVKIIGLRPYLSGQKKVITDSDGNLITDYDLIKAILYYDAALKHDLLHSDGNIDLIENWQHDEDIDGNLKRTCIDSLKQYVDEELLSAAWQTRKTATAASKGVSLGCWAGASGVGALGTYSLVSFINSIRPARLDHFRDWCSCWWRRCRVALDIRRCRFGSRSIRRRIYRL